MPASGRSLTRSDALRDNAFEAHIARVAEDTAAVASNRLTELDAVPTTRWNRRGTGPEAGMGVQTIGEAYRAGWRIHVRCAWGRREAMKSVRGCLGKAEIDLHALIWTRGS